MRKKAKVKEQENPIQENQTQETLQEENQSQTSYDEPDFEKLQQMKDELNQESESEKPQKKKRGRPKKSEIEIEQPLPDIDFSILVDLLITRLPNPQPLSESEKTLINSSGNKVFRKYFDNVKYSEEITLGIILFSIIYPRLKPSKKPNE